METSEVRDAHNSLWSPPSPISLSSQHLSFTYLSIWSNLGHRELKLLRSICMNAVGPNKYPQENPPKARWICSNHFRVGKQTNKKDQVGKTRPSDFDKAFYFGLQVLPSGKACKHFWLNLCTSWILQLWYMKRKWFIRQPNNPSPTVLSIEYQAGTYLGRQGDSKQKWRHSSLRVYLLENQNQAFGRNLIGMDGPAWQTPPAFGVRVETHLTQQDLLPRWIGGCVSWGKDVLTLNIHTQTTGLPLYVFPLLLLLDSFF